MVTRYMKKANAFAYSRSQFKNINYRGRFVTGCTNCMIYYSTVGNKWGSKDNAVEIANVTQTKLQYNVRQPFMKWSLVFKNMWLNS